MRLGRLVSIRACGQRLQEFINALHVSGIICMSQKYAGGEYTAKIYLSDIELMKKTADDYRIELYTEMCDGGVYRVMKYKTRYGIAAGVCFLFAFILFFSVTVVNIEINGNEYIKDDQIAAILEKNGIKHGAFIPVLNLSDAENEIRKEIADVSWAAVRACGGRIIVDVDESNRKAGSVHSNIPCNIVSVKDAKIVSVRPYRGSCVLREGDAAGKGDVIISGIIVNGSNDYVTVHASGEVKGEYTERENFVRYFEHEEKVYTGVRIKKYLYFFGYRIPLFAGFHNDIQGDYKEKTTLCSVFKHQIPLGIVNTEWHTYEYRTVTDTEEEAEKHLDETVAAYEQNFFSNCEVVSREIKKKIYDDRIEYETEYTVIGNIGTEKMIFPGKKEEDH